MNNSELEKVLGYEFRNKSLLEMALTHSSYNMDKNKGKKQKDNERLEFLGDAFLDAIISVELYKRIPSGSEGKLTKARAFLVCEKSLANMAKRVNLGKYINMGYGEDAAGGRDKDSILADVVEAIIGAIYLDGGFLAVENVILREFQPNIDLAIAGKLYIDYKSELQEVLQKNRGNVNIEYVTDKEEGPAHDRTFLVHVECDGVCCGIGVGKSKKDAEKHAARQALKALKEGEK